MLISLQKGGIDGAMLQDPSFFMAEDSGFKTLGDPAAMDIHYLQNVIAATRTYLRAQRNLSGRFIKAFVEGIAYYKRNKEHVIKNLMKNAHRTGNEGYFAAILSATPSQYFDNVPYVIHARRKNRSRNFSRNPKEAKGADPNSLVDQSFVKALDDSGFIKALY
jgi:ABC-type nitrate/sulfonate/bicarbonate transport system substrate-binding protein